MKNDVMKTIYKFFSFSKNENVNDEKFLPFC